MFSVKGDIIVGAHKKPFLNMAKTLGLSVQHYNVTEGHDLFHCSMIRYAREYPKCLDKIAQFVNDAKQNQFVEGVVFNQIKEQDIEPVEQFYEKIENKGTEKEKTKKAKKSKSKAKVVESAVEKIKDELVQ